MLICALASGLLATANFFTKERIKIAAQKEEESALKEVLPQAEKFEAVASGDKADYYKAYDTGGRLIGVAFIASAKGYSSVIEAMVGMRLDGTINAVKIISQNETPGLGSKITEAKSEMTIFDLFKGKKKGLAKPWFPAAFSQKSIEDISQVQAISGATISSSAVINSVRERALEVKRAANL